MMNDSFEFFQQSCYPCSSLASTSIHNPLLMPITEERKTSPIFSITRVKKLEEVAVKLETITQQIEVANEAKITGHLELKKLRGMRVLESSNGLKTQPVTPVDQASESDFYNQKIIQQRNKTAEEQSTSHDNTFKPNILYGHESATKLASQYKNELNAFLLHAFQAISVIKRLKPVPQQLIDTNKVLLPPTSSNCCCYLCRERDYCI